MSQEWKSDGDGGDDVQVPLGVGGESAPAEEYSESRGPRVNGSTLALVAAFAAALVVLYLLGLQNKPRTVSAGDKARAMDVDKKIDWILQNHKESADLENGVHKTNELITALREYFNKLMTNPPDPLEDPFVRDTVVVGPGPKPTQDLRYEDQKHLLAVQQELMGLKLNMIMMGNPPAALINGKLVTVGSKFELTSVAEIQADRVLMTSDGKDRNPLYLNSPKVNK